MGINPYSKPLVAYVGLFLMSISAAKTLKDRGIRFGQMSWKPVLVTGVVITAVAIVGMVNE